ncbi:MAG: chorismate--pyruvate lyase family protein [Alcanivoracaceae bacterium]
MKTTRIISPARCLDPELHWQRLGRVRAPESVAVWLQDEGSLTRRLQRHGQFSVRPVSQRVAVPTVAEGRLLGLRARQRALVREVLLLLNGKPVVFARSVLPLVSLTGANRVLGHMARRSLGAELFRNPRARRLAVWVAQVPPFRLPVALDQPAWGRQSLFIKRGRPLLVAEVFLPSAAWLWERPSRL